MRIGITGHQRLKNPARWGWVKRELDRLLSSLTPPLIGITSLAKGADQLFANAVLRHGGSLEIVIPFAGYESTFSRERDQQEYTRLLQHALKLEVLEKYGSDEEAYFASGKRMVDQSELLIAVWDGMPAAGLGGTGDVVNYAMQQRKRTIHFNPITREVEEL
ncbi:MAG: hypothetical protein LC803_09800 [Acidobacteria bacterium]|nr:hypothetical protein [Acidobacteriota bacterium]